jgi:cytochrome d ubiquinol oxidase subunit I
MGDIFGSPLAFEALIAFFLESTFAGIWIFYRHKISAGLRLITVIMIFIGTHMSAIWIITANGFMQNPVGYELAADGSKVILTDFIALITNPYALYMLVHTMTSAYLLASFFMLGVVGYHMLKGTHVPFFKTSAKLGLIVLLISALSQPMIGHFYGQYVGTVQPAKAAAFEVIWETEKSVPMYLIQIPIPKEERNINLLPIPYVGSIMYTNDPNGEITGIKEATEDWTPEMYDSFLNILPLTHYSFRIMVGLGMIFVMMAMLGCFLFWKDKYVENKWIHRGFLWLMPTPWIAILLGWTVAEVGRQPWIVNGLMLTKDAVSKNVPAAQVAFSLSTLVVFYGVLFAIEFYLLRKFIVKGPIDEPFKNRG